MKTEQTDLQTQKPQTQEPPGIGKEMDPVPETDPSQPRKKMKNKVLFITGGDSGIGKAVALLFAREGADVAIVYLNEDEDAEDTRQKIEQEGQTCLLIPGDLQEETFCKEAVQKAVDRFGRIDVLINNAATQVECEKLEDLSTEQMLKTFRTNIFSMFWVTRAALPHMQEGSAIVNSTSVTAFRGSSHLMDYAATKGAILSFTRSLSSNLISRKIRVNAVAPGPIWTPLIVSSFDEERVKEHGSNSPMKRAGEPAEVAPSYLFLACNEDSGYMTGQTLHPNGGEIVNG